MLSFDITDQLSFKKMHVLETLRLVIDPELNINIIDMGLVYGVKIIEPEQLISIQMTLTSSFCPMGESMVTSVKNCLELHFPPYKAEVELVWEPTWSYDNLTEEAKRILSV